MLDIQGVSIAAGEEQRVTDALAALAKDSHNPSELTVRVTLAVHREYPKHVTIGKDKDGNPVTKIVNNEDEEKAVLASLQPSSDEQGKE